MGIDEKDVLEAAVRFQIINGDRFLGKPVIGVEVPSHEEERALETGVLFAEHSSYIVYQSHYALVPNFTKQ